MVIAGPSKDTPSSSEGGTWGWVSPMQSGRGSPFRDWKVTVPSKPGRFNIRIDAGGPGELVLDSTEIF